MTPADPTPPGTGSGEREREAVMRHYHRTAGCGREHAELLDAYAAALRAAPVAADDSREAGLDPVMEALRLYSNEQIARHGIGWWLSDEGRWTEKLETWAALRARPAGEPSEIETLRRKVAAQAECIAAWERWERARPAEAGASGREIVALRASSRAAGAS